MTGRMKTGTFDGTGAAINLELGWNPGYMRVWNSEDGDECFEYFSGLTAGHALKTANHDTAQLSRITSAGFTAYAGATGTASLGITLGTAISEDEKTYHYFAMANE